MNRFAITCVLSLALSTLTFAEGGLRDEKGKHLDILQNGKPIARYMYEHDDSSPEKRLVTYKPFIHVFDADGKTLITKGPGGKFTHHRGIFLGWSKLGFRGKRYDMWHMKSSEIVHQKFIETKAGKNATVVSAQIHWNTPEDEVMIREVRTMTFHHSDPDALLLLDFHTVLTAADDVDLNGDPEHAGFQYRPHNDVVGNKSAKYVFFEEGANAKKNRDMPWVAMTYQLNGRKFTVQHMNHADNPKGTVHSAYRDYGRFGTFAKAKVAKGKSLILQHRIRVIAGDAPSRDMMAAQFRGWSGK